MGLFSKKSTVVLLTPAQRAQMNANARANRKERADKKFEEIEAAASMVKYGNKKYISFSFGSGSYKNKELSLHDFDEIMEHFKEYNIINVSSTEHDYKTEHVIWMVLKTEDQRFFENI